eukprot:TRINITY_DN24882_c0_g1_i1.p2 TRINITY_DN24882_c0_g1~~TRINITY_DN24882_c0_g1_i1.p2  ORF type:complete len:105 (+),score=11.30 TRINITY_DN24882_c0_g1_i1:29-316(+)
MDEEEGEIKDEDYELAPNQIAIKLKERSLQAFKYFFSKSVSIQLLERTTVSGNFCAIDGKQEFIQLSQMQTPLYFYEEAVIRVRDCLSMEARGNT